MKKELIAAIFMVALLLVTGVAALLRTPKSVETESVAAEVKEEAEATEVETTELDFSFLVKSEGQQPKMADFITAILTQEDIGEALGDMGRNWRKFLAGQSLPKNRSIRLDEKNRYMRFYASSEEDERFSWSYFIEFCCWDFSDGKHNLVVSNTVNYDGDGTPVDGQFSGVDFYLYDVATRKMELVSAYSLGAEFEMPEDTRLLVYRIFNKERMIECECYTPSGMTPSRLRFNGQTFEN